MKIKNPCLKCLVNPICKKPCNKFRDFEDFTFDILPIIVYTITILLNVILAILLFVKVNFLIATLIYLVVWLVSYLYVARLFEFSLAEYEFENIEINALIFASPGVLLGTLIGFIYGKINNIDIL